MSYDLFSTVGWRIAYAISGTLGFVRIYLRFKSTEPEILEARGKKLKETSAFSN